MDKPDSSDVSSVIKYLSDVIDQFNQTQSNLQREFYANLLEIFRKETFKLDNDTMIAFLSALSEIGKDIEDLKGASDEDFNKVAQTIRTSIMNQEQIPKALKEVLLKQFEVYVKDSKGITADLLNNTQEMMGQILKEGQTMTINEFNRFKDIAKKMMENNMKLIPTLWKMSKVYAEEAYKAYNKTEAEYYAQMIEYLGKKIGIILFHLRHFSKLLWGIAKGIGDIYTTISKSPLGGFLSAIFKITFALPYMITKALGLESLFKKFTYLLIKGFWGTGKFVFDDLVKRILKGIRIASGAKKEYSEKKKEEKETASKETGKEKTKITSTEGREKFEKEGEEETKEGGGGSKIKSAISNLLYLLKGVIPEILLWLQIAFAVGIFSTLDKWTGGQLSKITNILIKKLTPIFFKIITKILWEVLKNSIKLMFKHWGISIVAPLIKILISKFLVPLVIRALAKSASATVAGALGGILGGPIGTVIALILGYLIEWAVKKLWNFITGKKKEKKEEEINKSATGNLFKKPAITTVAENEPEIVLPVPKLEHLINQEVERQKILWKKEKFNQTKHIVRFQPYIVEPQIQKTIQVPPPKMPEKLSVNEVQETNILLKEILDLVKKKEIKIVVNNEVKEQTNNMQKENKQPNIIKGKIL